MDEPRSPWPGDAGDVLLQALLRLAREREDVRVAMTTVQGWLAEELAASAHGSPDTAGSPDAAGSRPSTGPQAGEGRPPTPQAGTPQTGTPQTGTPQTGTPQTGTPQTGTPEAVARLPLRVITPYTQARTGGVHEGPEQRGPEQRGPEQRGPEQRGPEQRGLGPREGGPRPARKVELSLVVRRARWKAAACRLALDLRGARDAGPESVDLRRVEDGLRRRREELEECPTWMLDSSRDAASRGNLEHAAACYETLALVAEGLVELEHSGMLTPAPPAELLYLLAETQSALLAAVHACDQRGDSDQRDLFLWLKEQTTRHRIYVDHHMRLDDPADPARSEERGQRFRELADRLLRGHHRRQFRGQLLNKIRFHVGKAREAEEAGDHADHGDHDWNAVGSAVEEWQRLGLSPEDGDLLALLRPLALEFGAARTLPEPLTRLLHECQAPARAAQRGGRSAPDGDASSTPRPAPLDQVAALLEGRRAVIFVRDEDIEVREPLTAALHLTQIHWVQLPTEDPLETVAREIAGEEVDLVLIAERLPEEQYAEFKRLCLESGRPFVRLPTGLEPDQVAHQVLRQVGWRLRGQRAATPS